MIYIYFTSAVAILVTLLYGRLYGIPASSRCQAVKEQLLIQYRCNPGKPGKTSVGEQGLPGRNCILSRNTNGAYECYYSDEDRADQRIQTDQITMVEVTLYTVLFFVCLWSTWTLYASTNQGRLIWFLVSVAGFSAAFFLA